MNWFLGPGASSLEPRATAVSALRDGTFAKYDPQLANDDKQGATREEKRVDVKHVIESKGAL